MRTVWIALVALGAGCSDRQPETSTLYRNSPYGVLRVHVATFDADDSGGGYNRDNCEMAARIYNANVAALRRANGKAGDSDVGFWCEPGRFEAKGAIPGHFEAQFPTDVQ
jgi:hypothetical protein